MRIVEVTGVTGVTELRKRLQTFQVEELIIQIRRESSDF